jgi:hypothetical protein
MRITNPARVAVACLVAGALACAGNSATVDDETAAAQQDTTDTAAAQQDTTNQAPPGYSGMERDTTMAADSAPTAVDTFLNEQGTGVPADTQGYGGLEQPDTSGMAGQQQGGYDTTSTAQPGYDTTSTTQPGYDTTGTTGQTDTSGMSGADTSGMGMDTTSMSNPQDSIPQ